MTERQKYEVIQISDGIEIRRYLPYVAADVVINEDYDKAASMGFRPLANYIFSNNISMTAPVIVEEKSPESWQVSFVMPHGSKLSDMPTPANNVKLRGEQEEICAAIKFNGNTSKNRIKKYEEKLLSYLKVQNIQKSGQLRIARFDPPWKPGVIRHNELIQPIIWNQ
jgi:hypothetical protein